MTSHSDDRFIFLSAVIIGHVCPIILDTGGPHKKQCVPLPEPGPFPISIDIVILSKPTIEDLYSKALNESVQSCNDPAPSVLGKHFPVIRTPTPGGCRCCGWQSSSWVSPPRHPACHPSLVLINPQLICFTKHCGEANCELTKTFHCADNYTRDCLCAVARGRYCPSVPALFADYILVWYVYKFRPQLPSSFTLPTQA